MTKNSNVALMDSQLTPNHRVSIRAEAQRTRGGCLGLPTEDSVSRDPFGKLMGRLALAEGQEEDIVTWTARISMIPCKPRVPT